MKIAIPVAEGNLATHFGHCQSFALIDVDDHNKMIVAAEDIPAPPHQPGLLPRWLKAHGVEFVIAGGMGQRAQALFAENGIAVMVGAPSEAPKSVVELFLAGRLETGANACDH